MSDKSCKVIYDVPEEIEYATQILLEYPDMTGGSTLKKLWTDGEGNIWLESVDGQQIVIPSTIRALAAKKIKEAHFR